MQILNSQQVLKEIKSEARKHGLTFARMKSVGTINGQPAYKFYPRGGGESVISNCTLGSAYNIVCAGDLLNHKQ